jgi:hypothetical protein
MIALAFQDTNFVRPGELVWRRPARSTQAATSSIVEGPASSSAASTEETDSPKVTPMPIWFQPVADRLRHLLALPYGWDGPGTLGVDEAVVVRTLRALFAITDQNTRPPSIAPGHDGSLQLAWYVPEFELEIDIPRSGNPSAWLYENSSDEESELPLNSPQLRTAIARLAAD